MENAIQIFNNPEFGDVRVVEINGEPYFVGRDVAEKLGYVNPNDALAKHVDAEDKRVSQIATPYGVQSMTVINEGGLYSLTIRSKMPNAKRFTRWLTHDVAISIRKTGVYVNPQTPISPEFLRQIADALEKANTKVRVLETQLVEAKPKVDYCNVILQCAETVSTTTIAKDYGYSAKTFNKLLRDLGVQFKQSGVWFPYQKYAKLGWTQTKTHKYMGSDAEIHCQVHNYWTQKGRLGLYHLLKEQDVLPLIEQC